MPPKLGAVRHLVTAAKVRRRTKSRKKAPELVALKRFKDLMRRNAGKLSFEILGAKP